MLFGNAVLYRPKTGVKYKQWRTQDFRVGYAHGQEIKLRSQQRTRAVDAAWAAPSSSPSALRHLCAGRVVTPSPRTNSEWEAGRAVSGERVAVWRLAAGDVPVQGVAASCGATTAARAGARAD